MLDRTIAQVSSAAELFASPVSPAVMRFLGLHQEFAGVLRDAHTVDTPLGLVPIPQTGSVPAGDTSALSVYNRSIGQRVLIGIRHDAIRCTSSHELSDEQEARERSLTRSSMVTLRDARVLSINHRAGGASAAVQLPNAVVHALTDPMSIPTVGSVVTVRIDVRGLIMFPA
jgi:ABC-type sugar transport system ATPase subunit